MLSDKETNRGIATDDALPAALARWKATVEAELKGAAFDKKLVTRTPEGIALQPLYTRADAPRNAHLQAAPGQAPFLRGARAAGHQQRGWQIAQEIAEAAPAAFNHAVLADLMHGQDCVVVDASGQPGGLKACDLPSLRTALSGIELESVPVHIRAAADPLPVAATYLALAAERRVSWDKLSGSLTADPLGEWAQSGNLPRSLESLFDSAAEWTTWSERHAPALRTVGVNARVWGDAGANAVHELAFALACAAEYLDALHRRGIAPATVAKKLRVQFAIGPQFFTEIAKFRAWRPLWTRVSSAFGAPATAAAEVAVHATTGRWNKTLLDPHVNMLRVTTEALSAVLGGCDALHIAPFDEVTGLTDDFSRRIARNIHTLLAEEFGFTLTADAPGGSWYIESLTDSLARQAWTLFQDIQARGGFSAALRAGHPQGLVAQTATDRADAINKRRATLIGTNVFPNLREKPLRMEAEGYPIAQAAALDHPLPKVGAHAHWPERIEAAMAAAREGASFGQLAQLSASHPQPEQPIVAVPPFRAAAGFERLRAASAAFAKRTGHAPRVFVAKMGPVAQHKARADFTTGFFATAGFEVLAKQAFDTPEAAAKAAAQSGAPIVVLCSSDDTYPLLVPAFAAAAKSARPELRLVLAGLPSDAATVDAYRAAGIDEFIHLRANVHAVLSTFLTQMGVLA